MRGKTIVTAVLLLFVAVSVGYLILNESRSKPEVEELLPWEMAEEAVEPAEAARDIDNGVVVYYFHGNVRCKTCRAIEAYTAEAVRTGFEDELASGRLIWKPVNVDDDGNEQFVLDYELSTRTVVLADFREGKRERWIKLEKVWQLVRDKEAFMRYITDNTTSFLAGHNG